MDNTHHNKRLKGMNDDACPRDRVSELPDPVIHHILSFVETKFVVRTSILSKRWRYIWATMPTFDLLLPQGHHREFIEKMFAVRQPSFNITKFALRSDDENLDASKLYQWITNLVRCNIQELSLALSVDKPIQLPISLFACESLLQLRLQLNNIWLSLPKSISIPKLKLLQLSDIGLDSLLAEQLIQNAPLLEELVLSKCSWSDWNGSTLDISAPALKYFRFHDPVANDGVRNGTVKIHAPNLRHLTWIGNIAKDYILSSFPSLDYAEVCFKTEGDHLQPRGAEIGLAASKLVGALSNVKSLTISGETLEALSIANDDLPTFQNLTHLTVTSECKSFSDKVLLKLFQSAPNLESLVFDKGLPICMSKEAAAFWKLTVRCPLARLKSLHLKVFSYWGSSRERDFIKLVSRNSKLLEKVTVGSTTQSLSSILVEIEEVERAITSSQKVKSDKEAKRESEFWSDEARLGPRHGAVKATVGRTTPQMLAQIEELERVVRSSQKAKLHNKAEMDYKFWSEEARLRPRHFSAF